MERITRKQVQGIFETWLKATGRRQAESYNDVGGYSLDYNGVYGGHVIVRIMNEQGGQDTPFGTMRRTNRAMWETLHFALRVAEERR